MKRQLLISAAAVVAASMSVTARAAEQPAAQPGDAASESAADNEIIVTAQFRTQALQDVPAAVTAVSGDSLERAAITSVTDLQVAVPSLASTTTNRPASGTIFSLRGVGTVGSDPGLEGAVGFFVDGVYRSRSGMGLGDLFDIDRLEVLRGPQGTLFGKNTTAGIIHVITKNPTNDIEGSVEGTVGNYNLVRLRGVLNLPVIDDKVAVRVAAGYHKRDGFLLDTVTRDTYNDRDRWNLSAKLLVQPTDDLSLLVTADYSQVNESCCQSVRRSNGSGAYIGLLAALAEAGGTTYPTTPTPDVYRTSVNGPVTQDNRDKGLSAEFKWDFGNAKLTSITAYRKFREALANDPDFSGADMFHQRLGFQVKALTQELRLQGNIDGIASGFDWLVGAFYSDEKINYREDVDLGPDAQPLLTSLSPILAGLYPAQVNAYGATARQTTESWALFTHNILRVTDRFSLTAGLRYTDDSKSAVTSNYNNLGTRNFPFSGLPIPFVSQHSYDLDYSDSAFTGTFVADYKLADDIMTYASYSRGYKGGGFSLGREGAGRLYSTNASCSATGTVAFTPPTIYACDMVDPRFKAETADSFELGFRSRLFDRKLTFNVTGFHAKYDNLQLATFNGLSFALSNAGSATTKGVEVEANLKTPVDGLSLGANVSYTDARFGKNVPALLTGEPAVGGQALSAAPRWTGSLTADYTQPVGDIGEFFLRGEFYFSSSQFTGTRTTSTGQLLKVPSYQLTNFSAGIAFDGDLTISAYCRNCFNVVHEALIFNSVAQAGSKDQFLASPREVGITIRKGF